MRLREGIHAAFHQPRSRVYRVVQTVVWTLIFLSIASLVAEPMLPADGRLQRALESADRALLIIFAIEYGVRVASFRPPALEVFHTGPFVRLRTHVFARIRLALSPMMLVDLLAVLAVFPELRGLRAMRLLRLLRTVKLFRYSNPFAVIIQAFEENSLLFTFGFTVLFLETLIGGVSVYLIESAQNPAINSLGDGIWWALVTLTTVGYGDVTPITTLGRIIGGGLMVGGMFTLALFAGFVGSSLVNAMLGIREEQFRMGDYVNHIVIFGHDDTSELLHELLSAEVDTDATRIVVFEDRERPREIPPNFLWVQGDPTKQSELDKVRLTHAAAALVVGSRDLPPQAADARTILSIFTIRSYLEAHASKLQGRRAPLHVVAEILDSENVKHARTAGANEVVETRRVGFSMLAHSIPYHGTADTMSRVLLSGSYNAYLGAIPDPPTQEIRYGDLLQKLRLTKRGGLIIGLRTPDGREFFNPPKDHMLPVGTELIYLSELPLLEPPA